MSSNAITCRRSSARCDNCVAEELDRLKGEPVMAARLDQDAKRRAEKNPLGRSADVDLAESTGEAIARIAARGDRIDRIQKETRTSLNALVVRRRILDRRKVRNPQSRRAPINREKTSKSKSLTFPSLRKLGEFLANVLALERLVDALKDRTKSLEAEVHRLSSGKSMSRPVN
jgi:hypothetical protein